MNGSLILRLVDITLLLLLSLMAVSHLTTPASSLPVTRELSDEGELVRPLQIGISSDGRLRTADGASLTMDEMQHLLDGWTREVEFLAEAEAPATRLIEIHAMVREYGPSAAFRVRQNSKNSS